MKYLACDLDGTLVNNNSIKDEDIKAILKLKEKGYKFIISTGRSLSGIDSVFDKYPEVKYDYIVSCNGCVILDKNREIIYDNHITSDIAEAVFKEFIDEKNICIHFESQGKNYLVDPIKTDDIEDLINYFQEIISIEDLFKDKRDYAIISLFARNKDMTTAEVAKSKLTNRFGDKLEAFRNQYFIDIVPKDCSKGNGILKVLELDGGNIEKLYTIGDSYNDISMFKITENSFTFKNSEDGVKAEANNYVDSVSECIEKLLES